MDLLRLLAKLVDKLPISSGLGGIASRYSDRCRGDNNSDFYTNGESQLLQYAVRNAKVVLDCGANVGDWARIALSVNPNLQIHCFEPSPANFARLKSLESTGHVVCNNLGVGRADEDRSMYVFNGSSEYNSVFLRRALVHDQGLALTETIRLTTIDGYLASTGIGHVDFLKIDVEGNELAALEGARRALAARQIDLVQFEYGATYIDARVFLQDIFDFIENLPYSAYKITPRGLQHVPAYEQRHENMAYQNRALIRRDWSGANSLFSPWSKRLGQPTLNSDDIR